ncbi:aminotransferase-like domain-containing protein [Streptomyces sp. A1-5]|uniref:aminotransferase-like domain-containing protein n=1 Tax=Streptomyces sp. A1-5 TaxID=2738410 RepID=UPI001F39A3C1|nr:PLP-dependent aminotransferase family protein [Streptomyces sp. A1-5]UJB43631.1 PLP-dependent aminotransferase family protein [Streptomyces sp. A1-5]
MEKSRATFGRDLGLDLHLDLDGPGGVRASLMSALREAVRSGRLAPGTRLPSSRSLATDLGIARNTVADAYAELVAEGWLCARQGSGTEVAERVLPRAGGGAPRRTPGPPSPTAAGPRFDLTPGTPDVSAFPRTAWLAAARRALTAAPNEAFGYGTAAGRPELRAVLADYLARVRGVRTDPDRIVICAGFMQGLGLLCRALKPRGGTPGRVATESYGLPFHRDVITRAGLGTVPLPVDAHGADTGRLADLDHLRAALLTPAHQFPTGVPLHPDRRAAAVNWARSRGGYVLEDDYDGEFRYDRQPVDPTPWQPGQRVRWRRKVQVGALQGLDPDHVVYLGTASKSLAPALRLAWMVVPDRLIDRVLEIKATGEWQSGSLDQLTLAEFIRCGAYDRHLRGMRSRYWKRFDRLTEALATRAPHIGVLGIAAGLHVVLQLPPGTEQDTVHAARREGLPLEGLSRFRYDTAESEDSRTDGLVVTYGRPSDHAFTQALEILLRVLPK